MGSQKPQERIQQQAATIAELRKMLAEQIEVVDLQAARMVDKDKNLCAMESRAIDVEKAYQELRNEVTLG